MAREVKIAILGDSRDFGRAVSSANRDASSLEKHFGRVSGGVAALGKAAAIGAAGLVVGGAALAKGFVEAAIESQKVTKQTEAVLKSMGGAAGVTASQVSELSTKLSLQTGVDDELIQSGQNLLLTFGNVRNGVKKTEKNFDRATAAALDMSVALGTDMTSASKLVGKALNDPIKGLAALTKSGIQFTDQQKNQIKAMVEVGDVAGAQRIMLDELEKQFGGSAEAQATSVDKLKVAFGNIQEEIGARLLPAFETFSAWLAEKLPVAIAAAEPVIAALVAWFKDAGEKVGTFVTEKLQQLRTWWDEHGPAITEAAKGLAADFQSYILDPMGKVATFVTDTLVPALGKIVTWILENKGVIETFGVLVGVTLVRQFALAAAAAVSAAATSAVAWFIAMWPILLCVGAVAALTLATDWLIKKFELLPKLGNVLQFFLDLATNAWAAVKPLEKIESLLDGIKWASDAVFGSGDWVNGALPPGSGRPLARAHGGSVSAGSPYLVGERGPELFMPGRSGTIIPNGNLGGGSGVTNNFYITALDPVAAARAVKDALRVGGSRGVA